MSNSLSLSRNKIKWIFKRESIKKQFVIVDFYTSREGINSRCCRFGSIFRRYDRYCCRSCCRWRSIDRDWSWNSVFAIAFVCFSRIKNCQTERDLNSWEVVLSVDTISFNCLRHLPRQLGKNCDLQFANTDRFKENYSIDIYLMFINTLYDIQRCWLTYLCLDCTVVSIATHNKGYRITGMLIIRMLGDIYAHWVSTQHTHAHTRAETNAHKCLLS